MARDESELIKSSLMLKRYLKCIRESSKDEKWLERGELTLSRLLFRKIFLVTVWGMD